MSHNKSNNEVLISRLSIINPVTGECRIETDSIIENPENIAINDKDNGFYKFRKRLFKTFNKNEISYLVKLVSDKIEYNTGRLRIGGVGKKPIPIKTKKQISKILEIDRGTTRYYYNKWEDKYAIFKIDGNYYINPSFIQFGRSIYTDIFRKMVKLDKELLKYISKSDKRKLSYFRMNDN